jgi:hypothetical protein
MSVDIATSLANYIATLYESAINTTRAEDRSLYTQHLANAALLFAAFQKNASERLSDLIGQERRAYGTAFLSGEVGAKAEAAFNSFADSLERWLSRRG